MKSYGDIIIFWLLTWVMWGVVAWVFFDPTKADIFIIGILAYVHAHQPYPEKP